MAASATKRYHFTTPWPVVHPQAGKLGPASPSGANSFGTEMVTVRGGGGAGMNETDKSAESESRQARVVRSTHRAQAGAAPIRMHGDVAARAAVRSEPTKRRLSCSFGGALTSGLGRRNFDWCHQFCFDCRQSAEPKSRQFAQILIRAGPTGKAYHRTRRSCARSGQPDERGVGRALGASGFFKALWLNLARMPARVGTSSPAGGLHEDPQRTVPAAVTFRSSFSSCVLGRKRGEVR